MPERPTSTPARTGMRTAGCARKQRRVTAVARFRLFGRTPAPATTAPPPDGYGPGYGPPSGRRPQPPTGPPPVGAGAPPPAPTPTGWAVHPAGPATSAARPAARPAARSVPADDTPTDPHGFAPVSVPTTAPVGPDPSEAAALAGAFAVDYLSWDEDDPERRGRVLRDYLPVPVGDPARLGWSGHGRQRAEFALPGRVRADGECRVLVDVRVRVTPYRSVGERTADPIAPEPEPIVAGVPASAPAPTGKGWRSHASNWIRLTVPVVLENGRLVVDAGEETLGDELPPPSPVRPPSDDHVLADDDPLVEPQAGGAW